MNRISWSDVIFWLALLVLLVWLILKALGYINTLTIVEIIPYISGIFMLGAAWQQFRQVKQDISYIKNVNRRFLRIEHEHNLFMEGLLEHKKN